MQLISKPTWKLFPFSKTGNVAQTVKTVFAGTHCAHTFETSASRNMHIVPMWKTAKCFECKGKFWIRPFLHFDQLSLLRPIDAALLQFMYFELGFVRGWSTVSRGTREISACPKKSYSAYHQIVTIKVSKTVTIWRIFEFSSVVSWQFSKISQKIAKRNYLVVGTVNNNVYKNAFKYLRTSTTPTNIQN